MFDTMFLNSNDNEILPAISQIPLNSLSFKTFRIKRVRIGNVLEEVNFYNLLWHRYYQISDTFSIIADGL